MNKQKCPRCRCLRLVTDFGTKRLDIPYKTCVKCRETSKKYKRKKCLHGREKNKCRDCQGSQICTHNRVKSFCKECEGSQICPHSRQKSKCRGCGGVAICEHNKLRNLCQNCGGASICEHHLQRRQCAVCTPERACQSCLSVYVPPGYRFEPYCFRCFCVLNPDAKIQGRYRLKEHYLKEALKEAFPSLSMVFNKTVNGGCSKRRPDVRIECLTHTIIVECDENQHKSYFCERRRLMELFQDLGNRPIVMIRFNPDSYLEDGRRIDGCFHTTKTGFFSPRKKEWKWRLKELRRTISRHLHTVPGKEVTEETLFYNWFK